MSRQHVLENANAMQGLQHCDTVSSEFMYGCDIKDVNPSLSVLWEQHGFFYDTPLIAMKSGNQA